MCSPGACRGNLCGDGPPGSGCSSPGCVECHFGGLDGSTTPILDAEVNPSGAIDGWHSGLTHAYFGALLGEDRPASGLLAGDLVVKIGDKNVHHVTEYLHTRYAKQPLVLTVYRRGFGTTNLFTVTTGDPASIVEVT